MSSLASCSGHTTAALFTVSNRPHHEPSRYVHGDLLSSMLKKFAAITMPLQFFFQLRQPGEVLPLFCNNLIDEMAVLLGYE